VCGQPAGWRVLADRARLGLVKVAAARFRCRPGRGHIVAAARLQLVYYADSINMATEGKTGIKAWRLWF